MDHSKIKDRYNIIKTIGEGGMGILYLAEDKANSNRLTAIKTINAEYLEKQGSLQLFKHEYDIMGKLWHPNLARVYDFGEIDGGLYLTMEYIKGRELSSIIKEKGKLHLEEALSIMIELLRAMEFVHSRNIIYGDIKPQNILITEDNHVKLIDFGLSDFEDKDLNEVIKGTIEYMSPEVLNGTAKDHRSDIFSLGVLFYKLLTGDFLYKDISFAGVLNTLKSDLEYNFTLQGSIVKLDYNPLKEIIKKMCAYSAKDRFFSCSEIIYHLNTGLNTQFLLETVETKEAFVVGTPFTGRERELKYLKNCINSNENKMIVIMGDQGIGKSKLLKEFEKWCNLNNIIYLNGNAAKGTSYEPFMTILYKVLFSFEKRIFEQQKMYLKKIIPYHPALSCISIQGIELMDGKPFKDLLVKTISSIIIQYALESGKKTAIVFENLCNTDEISLEIINEILYKVNQNNIMNLKLFAECRSEDRGKITDFIVKHKEKNRLNVLNLYEFTEAEVKQYIENSFGKKSIDETLFNKIKDIYEYCGGNPLFLKELIKSMVADDFIRKDRLFWQFSGPFSNVKPGNNLLDIICRKIKGLKLPDNYYQAMVFLSFSAYEKLFIDFYLQYAKIEFNINWQNLFDFLVRKELLQLENDYYIIPNKLYKEALHSMLSPAEVVRQHKIWVKILERQLTPDFIVEELSDKLLFSLSYHYYNSNYKDLEVFLAKTGRFLLESGKREKAKYSNQKAIDYFSRLKKVMDNMISDSSDLLRLKLEVDQNLAQVFHVIGKWDKAEGLYRQCLQIAEALEDESLIGACMMHTGRLVMNKGLYSDAIILLEDSKKIALKSNNKNLYSNVVGILGIVYYCMGRCAEAMKCYEEQKQICLELGDRRNYSVAAGNMGNIYSDQGDHFKAMECYEEQKQICLELKDKRNYSVAVGNMGNVYRDYGDFSKAMECYEEQRQICQELEDRQGYSIAVGNMGNVYSDLGNFFNAMEYYEEYKQICLELGNTRNYSIAVANLGTFYLEQGEYAKAIGSYEEAIKIGKELQIKYLLSMYLHYKANVHYELKDYGLAKTINHEAQSIASEIQSKDVIFNCSVLCNKLLALDSPEEAVKSLNQMIKSEAKEENQALVHYEIYKINHSAENLQKALELFQRLYQKTPKYHFKKKIEELNQL